MGWAFGTNAEGREIGYGVEAVCDKDGCDEKIDRGLGYVCGGMHDGDEHGCGRYFCGSHLVHVLAPDGPPLIASPQLCEECAGAFEAKLVGVPSDVPSTPDGTGARQGTQ